MDLASTGVTAATQMEPKRIAGIAYVVLGFALAMFLSHVAAASLAALHINDTALLGIEDLTISSVVGFGIAIGLGIFLWMNARVQATSVEIATELKRVTWPSFAETRVSTIAVVIASLVASTVLFIFDFFASKIMTEWMPAILGWFSRL